MQTRLQGFLNVVEDRLATPDDSDTLRARKVAVAFMHILGMIFLGGWLVAFVLIDSSEGVWVSGAAILLFIVNLIVFFSHKNLRLATYTACLFILANMVGYHLALGGFFKSGMALIWLNLMPLITSVILEQRDTIIMVAIAWATLIAAVIFEPQISTFNTTINPHFGIFSSAAAIGFSGALMALVNLFLVRQLNEAREQADTLLLNILPASIADQLKRSPGTIADGHNEVTVLFADIVDFTTMSSGADPVDVVEMLNRIFSDFDQLATKHGLEKIKTIGDAYMIAGGLPDPKEDHVEAVVAMALDMLEALKKHQTWEGDPIRLRIGINTGPVVAGVIGQQKFIYDLWGDAVNTASRMESNGMANVIQVTKAVKDKLAGQYIFEEREPIYIKGKGEMVTYLLQERVPPVSSS